MNYYEHHLGDYARDTAHLTMLEHGAYRCLLDRYYITEAGIPAEQAHRLARARTNDEIAAVDAVLADFFELVDGVWINHRAEAEIVAALQRIESATVNGKKGGRPPKPKRNPNKTQPFQSGYENENRIETGLKPDHNRIESSPISNLQSPNTPLPPKGAVSGWPGFDDFWKAYPRKTAKHQAQKAWEKLKPSEQLIAEILDGIERATTSDQWAKDDGKFIPHPATFLNNRRWEDEHVNGSKRDPFDDGRPTI